MNDFDNGPIGSSTYEVAEGNLGFFGAILGLFFAPRTTLKTLFLKYPTPPYAFAIPLFLFLVIVVPSISQILGHVIEYRPLIALSVFLITLYAVFLFIESWLLFLFAIDIPPSEVFALVGYCAAPIICALLFLFAIDYYLTGHLELLFLYNLGEVVRTPVAALWLGVVEIVVTLLVIYIIANSLQITGTLFVPSTLFFTFLSCVALVASFLLALYVATKINPVFATQFEKFVSEPYTALKTTLLNPSNNVKFKLIEM